MSIGTLYAGEATAAGRRIRATALEGGFKFDSPTGYEHFVTNKTPEFLAKFASGKIPAFEDETGFTLFEGAAIARYVAALNPKVNLLGTSLKEAALVDQWVSYFDTEILVHIRRVNGFLNHYITPYHKAFDQAARDDLARPLGVVEKYLSTRTFLVGERLTLADISAASVLRFGYATILDKKVRDEHPHTLRFFNTIVNQPASKSAWGELEFVEKTKTYTAPPKEKKPAAAPAEAKPKAEKAKAKKEDDDDDDEPLVPEEPKKKNPLDDLPKSEFNLEDWKRAYSNMDTRGSGGAIEWFYEKFDRQGFSVWRVDFKYPSELTQVFMSSNLIGGFFNRLEGSRKYLFGSVGVLGTNNDSLISGVLILRGQDHKAVVEVAPDWESYEFQRLDIDGDGKQFFEAALAWDLEIDGKKWADGKNFK